MPKVTKFLSLYNELFGQEIPIQNNALTWICITFHGIVLSVLRVIASVINIIGSLKVLITFRILVIALISNPMCLSMKVPKKIIDKKTRHCM